MSSQLVFNKITKMGFNRQTIETKLADLQKSLSEKLNNINTQKSTSVAAKKEIQHLNEELIEATAEYIKFNNELIDEIKKSSQKSTQNNTKSFAEAVKTKQIVPKMKTKEVVIVYPEVEMTSEELKNKLKSKLDFKSIGNIGITSVKKIRNNGLVIECNSKNECNKLEENINEKLKDFCKARLPEKRNPRLIIYNIYNDKESDQSIEDQMNEIKETIISQNDDIKQFITDNTTEELITKFFVKSKNESFKHLVIEVTPGLRKVLINCQKLNIFWSRNTVKDFISITRCFKCLGFGHTRNHCTVSDDQCSTCAGAHSHLNCKSKTIINCINCLKHNQNNKNPNFIPFDTKHNALYSECPSLKRIKNLIISKINYE